MVEYNRPDVSKRIDVNKTNGLREYIICDYWYFLLPEYIMSYYW